MKEILFRYYIPVAILLGMAVIVIFLLSQKTIDGRLILTIIGSILSAIYFVQKQKLPFPVYSVGNIELEKLANAVIKNWDATLPTTVIIDKEGNIRNLWSEQVHLSELTSAVKPLIE